MRGGKTSAQAHAALSAANPRPPLRAHATKSGRVPRLWHDGRCRVRLLSQGARPAAADRDFGRASLRTKSEGSLLTLSKLRRALRAERRRMLAGHWSYELNRHLGLITPYQAELGLMRRAKLRVKRNAPGAARSTSGAPGKDDDASPAFHQLREPTR